MKSEKEQEKQNETDLLADGVPAYILEIERKLKLHCVDYALVASTNGKISTTYSTHAYAIGAGKILMRQAQDDYFRDDD